jgi:sterol desaturase/sphingolipid hydroxylase (fatty acid hydroxylase superfamily)
MERFVAYFAEMPTWHRLAWVAVCMTAAWLAEDARPLLRSGYRKWSHAGVNLRFFALVAIVGSAAGLAFVRLFDWVEGSRIGLLQRVDWPLWAQMLVALLALDLAAQYTAHFLLHKIGFLWRFHVVHHSDRVVDATTGTRIHPGDYVFRELLAAGAVIVFGIPIAFYLLYRSVTVVFTYATHANIDMPRGLDRALSYVFVTPNMHKFHHHFELPWTDSNYGNVLSVWDRLFGTFVYDDVEKIRYGLDMFDERLTDDVLGQLKMPFRRSPGGPG